MSISTNGPIGETLAAATPSSIFLMLRPPLLLLAPDLAGGGVEDAVDDEARDLLAGDALLLNRLRKVEGGGDGLARGVLAADDLNQRHHRGRERRSGSRRPARAAASRGPSR